MVIPGISIVLLAMAAAVCCSGGVDENYEVPGGPDGDDDDDDPELEALLVVRADRGGSSFTTTNLEQQTWNNLDQHFLTSCITLTDLVLQLKRIWWPMVLQRLATVATGD